MFLLLWLKKIKIFIAFFSSFISFTVNRIIKKNIGLKKILEDNGNNEDGIKIENNLIKDDIKTQEKFDSNDEKEENKIINTIEEDYENNEDEIKIENKLIKDDIKTQEMEENNDKFLYRRRR